jgi:hypothetical protein
MKTVIIVEGSPRGSHFIARFLCEEDSGLFEVSSQPIHLLSGTERVSGVHKRPCP